VSLTAPESAPDRNGASFAEVRRIHRRICLLRNTGDTAGADRLAEHELASVLAQLPATDDLPARLREVYAAEEERVADAFALASLLTPMLAHRLAASLPAQPRPLAEIVPLTRHAARQAGRGNIADFIDEMLAAEEPSRSTR
jgi:hypothetical protein